MMTVRHLFKLSFALIVLAVALAASSVHAQVPANPILWLRADTGLETTRSGISIWHDQSGLHHDATQNDTTHRPVPLGNGINGLPTVHFGGNAYMDAPTIFPKFHDFSVSGVIRLSDTSFPNNILSGNTHAIWFNSTSYLQVHHWIFELDARASVPVRTTGSCFTIVFDAAFSTARLYLDGRLSDSLWTYYNDDSTLYVGSFARDFFLHGDISELLMYDRTLNSSEVAGINQFMQTKYGISTRPAPPPPDTTFSSIPARLQFFPRNAQDSATLQIAGTLRAVGFDSIYLVTTKNGSVTKREAHSLQYADGSATFSFETTIHAELSEYAIRVGVLRPGFDSTLAIRDSIVCGDAFLIGGQSNAIRGFVNEDPKNEYCRTFGVTDLHNAKDAVWSFARSLKIGYGNCISAWAYQCAQLINESLHIPVCIIDGASVGGYIEWNLRNDADPTDLNTIYGELLYRVRGAHLEQAVKAYIWDQGEWNSDINYESNFTALHEGWLKDYPTLQKVYVIQMRPNNCAFPSAQRKLMDLERRFPSSMPNVVTFASAAIPRHDGCHMDDSGYRLWGTQLFHAIARDIYHNSDSIDIACPNIREAHYTSPAHDSIRITFDPPTSHLQITNDTLIAGRLRTMHDYFYLDDSGGRVNFVRAEGNSLLLGVSHPTARRITYLPDDYYPEDSVVYEGPWIVTARGVGALGFCDVSIGEPLAVSEPIESALSVRALENPAHGRISLLISGSGSARLEIYDALGRALVSMQLGLNPRAPLTFSTDLPGRTSAAYFCRVAASSGAGKTVMISCER